MSKEGKMNKNKKKLIRWGHPITVEGRGQLTARPFYLTSFITISCENKFKIRVKFKMAYMVMILVHMYIKSLHKIIIASVILNKQKNKQKMCYPNPNSCPLSFR